MLLSAVFVLKPCQEAMLPLTTGNAVHATFLECLRRIDPNLAGRLHAPGREKPFTVSPLSGGQCQERSHTLHRNQECWLRCTSLDPALSQRLLSLSPGSVGRLTLFGVEFTILKVCTEAEAHPWAGLTTCADLFDTWFTASSPPPRKIRLHFFTPTTFRSGKQNLPFPLAHLIFFSLGEKWKRYAPAPLGSEIDRLLDELGSEASARAPGGPWARLNEVISLARYDLRTQILDFGRYKQVGFIGDAEFLIANQAPVHQAQLFSLLADFAFYAGVGYKTTMGMGQTWRVDVEPPP